MTNHILCVFTLVSCAAFAQDTGRLTGSVIDSTGAAIPNAKVELRLPGGASAVIATTTTVGGLFSFIGIRIGE